MKLYLLLFIALLLVSSVSAETIYSKYIYVGDSFEAHGEVFSVVGLTNGGNTLVLQGETDTYFIRNSTCEETDFYDYCFKGKKLDYMTYGRQIPNSLDWEPALGVDVISITPKVTIKKTFRNEVNRDDSEIVSIEINNDGDTDINNLFYTEDIINAESDSSYEMGNKIKWSLGFLKAGDKASFSYSLSPTSYDSIWLNNTVLKYDYSDKFYNATYQNKRILINSPIYEKYDDKFAVGVGEEFELNYELRNDDWNDRMSAVIEISIPNSLEVLSVSDSPVSHDLLRTFSLDPSDSEKIVVKLKAKKEGLYQININSEKNIRKETYSDSNSSLVNVSLLKLEPTLKLSKSELFEENSFVVSAELNNPSDIAFTDVSAFLSVPGFEEKNYSFSRIEPGAKSTISEQFIVPPQTNISKDDVVLRGSYTAIKKLFFNTSKEITYKPFIVDVDVTKTYSKNKVSPGEEVLVTLKAKNAGEPVTLKLRDSTNNFLSGVTEKELYLNRGQELNFYVYKVKAGNQSFNTTTEVIYDSEIIEEITKNITVEGSVDVSPQVNTTSNTNNSQASNVPEEKDTRSLVKKIIAFFVNLFT